MESAHMKAVREAEATSVAQASKLPQVHQETMQTLEEEAIKEKECAHQSFLWACGTALQACPTEDLGILMYPIHLLMGNMSLTGLLMAAPWVTISSRDPIPSSSCSKRPTTATHSTGAKQQHLPAHEADPDCSGDRKLTSTPGELPQQRQRKEDPLAGNLGHVHQPTFLKDSDLVRFTRQTYFEPHWAVFNRKVAHDLTAIFKEMQKQLASWTAKSTRFRTSGRVKRSSTLPTTLPRVPPRTSVSSRWCCLLNFPRSWASRGSTLPKPWSIKPASHSVPGVEKRVKMKGQL